MDDATQKPGTCPTCRHAEHEGHICLNMASDNDCGCDKRPPKVFADATQKLVDEAREEYERAGKSDGRVWYGLVGRLADALEAAQRPPEGEAFAEAFERFSMGLDYSNRDEAEAGFRAGWEAAQRPPVSPEVREALANVLWERFKAGRYAFHSEEMADAILARFSFPSQPVTRESLRPVVEDAIERWADLYPTPQVYDVLTDAILAQWPSQPVYDEDAIERAARALHAADDSEMATSWESNRAWYLDVARAALVAALRSGELTREETNE